MKRALVSVFTLLIVGCSSSAPAPTKLAELQPCTWQVGTQSGFVQSFRCLDGSQPAQGLPAPAIVNVWGSWCPPCREEIPYFVKLDQKYQVTIIGIDVDEPSLLSGQRFAQKAQMSWPNLIDAGNETTAIYGQGVPVTWFIGADGKVAYRKIGAWKSYAELEEYAQMYGQIQ